MIFGFNTDVKHGDTVYHVQSEARQSEFLFQTQVFVRGRCIGKRATSYADRAPDPFFSDKQKEAMLRDQHRYVLEAIREGNVESVFDKRDTPETLAAIKPLELHAHMALGRLGLVLEQNAPDFVRNVEAWCQSCGIEGVHRRSIISLLV